jgi:hypothetical protein
MAKQMRGAEDPAPDSTVETDVAPDTEVAAEEGEGGQYVVVEYVGEPPYGREFLTSHTIQKSSADPKHRTERLSFAGQGIEVPEDLVWSKENSWKVKVDASLTDLLEGLRAQPFLKVRD